MNKYPKIIVFAFFFINLIFIWGSLKITNLFVDLARLDELNGYMLTDEEEIARFRLYSILMLLIQVLFQYFIIKYLRKNHVHKAIILLNIVANAILFLWFVYEVYDFTINGY